MLMILETIAVIPDQSAAVATVVAVAWSNSINAVADAT